MSKKISEEEKTMLYERIKESEAGIPEEDLSDREFRIVQQLKKEGLVRSEMEGDEIWYVSVS